MNTHNDLVADIADLQRQIQGARHQLTAPATPQSRAENVQTLSDLILALIQSQERLQAFEQPANHSLNAYPASGPETATRARDWWMK